MKTAIHPQYYGEAKVICTCGNTFTTGSTQQTINVEVCYKCHPMYTGEHRFVDVQGRVESFQKKQAAAKQYNVTAGAKRQKKQGKEEKKTKSLRELLQES